MPNKFYTITSVVSFIGLTERSKSKQLIFEISRETITRLRRKRETGLSFVQRLTGSARHPLTGDRKTHNDTVYYYFIFRFFKLDCRTTNAQYRRLSCSALLFRYNYYCLGTPAHVVLPFCILRHLKRYSSTAPRSYGPKRWRLFGIFRIKLTGATIPSLFRFLCLRSRSSGGSFPFRHRVLGRLSFVQFAGVRKTEHRHRLRKPPYGIYDETITVVSL